MSLADFKKEARRFKMGNISSFVYCDNIQTEYTPQGPIAKIVNPLQVITPYAIPGNYSFAISCNINGLDVTKTNDVQIRCTAPNGDDVYDTGIIHIQLPREEVIPDKPGALQFNLDLRNIVIKEAGTYETKVLLNGAVIGSYRIDVVAGA